MKKKVSIVFMITVFLITLCWLGQQQEIASEAQAKTTFTAGVGTPVLDGVVSPGEWPSDSITTSRGLTMRAMIDQQNLYILAQWADSTRSVGKNRWTFDGQAWGAAGDEDRLGIVWEIKDEQGNGLNGEEGASCTSMCHAPKMWTSTGRVDVWHWKANRTNPLGFPDDKYWDTCQECDDGGRHGDSGSGSGGRNRNAAQTGPEFMAASGHGANVDFLAETQADLDAFDPFGVMPGTVDLVAAIGEGTVFSAGDGVPGRLLQVPTGNRASVRSAGKWANGMWTVEFSRKLAGEVDGESNPEDFAVVQGGSVQFTTDTFDDTDTAQHAFADGGADFTVYTLNFPYVSNLNYAQFADGQGLFSQLTLYSLDPPAGAASTAQDAGTLQDGGVATNVKIVLKDSNGQPLTVDLNGQQVTGELETQIPAGSVRVFKTDGVGDIVAGSVAVSADRMIDGVVLFGGTVGLAGVGNSQELSTGFTAPMEVNTSSGTNTGIAVMNLTDGAVTLDLTLCDSDGNVLATAQVQISADGQLALNVTEFGWGAEVDFSEFVGLLKVTSSGNVAATVIQTRPGQYATMPVSPN